MVSRLDTVTFCVCRVLEIPVPHLSCVHHSLREVMDLPAVLTGLAGPLDGLDKIFIVGRRQVIRHEGPVGEM